MKQVVNSCLLLVKIWMQRIELYCHHKKHYQNKEKAKFYHTLQQNKETNKTHPLHYRNSKTSTLVAAIKYVSQVRSRKFLHFLQLHRNLFLVDYWSALHKINIWKEGEWKVTIQFEGSFGSANASYRKHTFKTQKNIYLKEFSTILKTLSNKL